MGNDIEVIERNSRCAFESCPTPAPASPEPEAETEAGPAMPSTAREVAEFVPDGGEVTSEPEGFAVVGEKSRFTASISVGTVDAELLGQAVRVRFEPVEFHWTWGDGSRSESTRRSTSHVFGESGRVTVSVVPSYRASLAVDGGAWQELSGTVDGAELSTEIRVVELKSVLVGEDCIDNPDGPGC